MSTKLSTKNLEGKITSKQPKETSNPKPLNQIDKVVQLKKKMSVTQNLLLFLMIIASVMVYLTYSPADYGYFWTYWVNKINCK